MMKWSTVKSPQQILVLLCTIICVSCVLFEVGIFGDFRHPRITKDYHDFITNLEERPPSTILSKQAWNFTKLDNYTNPNSKYIDEKLSIFPDKKEVNKKSEKKLKAVIIVASYRTGSSFIGQLFNQHPDVFYLFEPLFFSNWPRVQGNSVDKVVEDLFLCNMDSMKGEIQNAWTEANENYRKQSSYILRKRLMQINVCKEKGLCFRGKSQAICTRQMCGNATSVNCKSCQAPPPYLMKQACLKAKVRVFKVIRIEDLMTLKRAWNNSNIELKIIHLVRDPRPTLLSRLRLHKGKEIVGGKMVSSTCRRNVAIQKQYLTNDTEFRWLNEIYKLVRYEDMIENPQTMVKELYDFINYENFTVVAELQDWIKKSTNATDYKLFGTSRDTNEQKYKWRAIMTIPLLKSVQEYCKDMMSLFGYKPASSRGQLLNYSDPLLIR